MEYHNGDGAYRTDSVQVQTRGIHNVQHISAILQGIGNAIRRHNMSGLGLKMVPPSQVKYQVSVLLIWYLEGTHPETRPDT